MTIEIKDLEFFCIIGILDFERAKEQLVRVNCQIQYRYQETFINYALVAEAIQNEMQKQRFELIETALLHLKSTLKEEFPLIETLFLKISKPDILDNCEVSLSETTKY